MADRTSRRLALLALCLSVAIPQLTLAAPDDGDLAFRPGERVADIGAGSGYFTLRVARAVGTSAEVLAIDINPDRLEFLDQCVKEAGLANVRTVRVEKDDPKLSAGGVDTILMVDTLQYVAGRDAYAMKMRAGLAPGAASSSSTTRRSRGRSARGDRRPSRRWRAKRWTRRWPPPASSRRRSTRFSRSSSPSSTSRGRWERRGDNMSPWNLPGSPARIWSSRGSPTWRETKKRFRLFSSPSDTRDCASSVSTFPHPFLALRSGSTAFSSTPGSIPPTAGTTHSSARS